MFLLELITRQPDWFAALEVAMTLPEGMSERRSGENPWAAPRARRPRRISDDLLVLRDAYEHADAHGLVPIDDDPSVICWEVHAAHTQECLERLRDRGVLQAAGFLLHEEDGV
jgi:hypothetical protein